MSGPRETVGTSVLSVGPTRQYNLLGGFQQDMQELLDSGRGSDVSFVFDDFPSLMRAHSSVIAVRCKSFRAAVVRFLTERKKKDQESGACLEIQIPASGMSERAFYKVLKFIYTGTIDLRSHQIYDVCYLAGFLGVESLQGIAFSYLQGKENIHQIATALDRALENSTENQVLLAKLTRYLAENCAKVLKRAPIRILSQDFMLHVVKQENLWASELELWNSLIAWCCGQCGISPAKKVSDMTECERTRVALLMKDFCRPGRVRILNFGAQAFSAEVEPLGVFSPSEVLLKYRFEAAAGIVDFDNAFPFDRYNFLTRSRQRTMCFESSTHPHPRGVRQTFEVQLPAWVSETKVVFDSRTALGRYADLEFFADEGMTIQIFSVRNNRQSRYSCQYRHLKMGEGIVAKPDALAPIFISGNAFWVSFYAPLNVGDLAWGYKFFVSIVR